MLNTSCDYRQPQLYTFFGGCLAVSLLWLLALWNLGFANDIVGRDASHPGVVASQDMPLHANSEHSLSLKRLFYRHKVQTESIEGFVFAEPSNPTGYADPIWSLPPGEFIFALFLSDALQNNSTVGSSRIYLHLLQTLNAPRAPPIV